MPSSSKSGVGCTASCRAMTVKASMRLSRPHREVNRGGTAMAKMGKVLKLSKIRRKMVVLWDFDGILMGF